jgi:hypothetical protein
MAVHSAIIGSNLDHEQALAIPKPWNWEALLHPCVLFLLGHRGMVRIQR